MEQYFCKKQVKAINSFTSFIFFNRTCLSRWSPRPTGGRARDSGPEVDAVFRSPVSTKSAKTKDTCNVKFIKTNTAAIQQEKLTLNIFLIFWWSGFTNNEKNHLIIETILCPFLKQWFFVLTLVAGSPSKSPRLKTTIWVSAFRDFPQYSRVSDAIFSLDHSGLRSGPMPSLTRT